MTVVEFVRTVGRKADKKIIQKGSRKICWVPKSMWKMQWVDELKMATSYAMILTTSP